MVDGRELDWDDSIENDGQEFITLPEGDYDFEIIDFERGRHNGSDKLPACKKATVHVKIQGLQGIAIVKKQLFLHTITEGLLCEFFTGIGQRKKGEKFTMNWGKVIGSKGRCKVSIRNYTSDKGEPRTSNEIKKFYEPEEKKGFEAGRF